jgi:tetratricopeptide (TPR) repeat protein
MLILNNEQDAARKLLNDALPAAPSNIRLWELLAGILLRTGEYAELANRVYPAVRSATSRREHYLLYMLRGYLYMHNGPNDYTAARAAFLRALALNKNLTAIQQEVLRLDDALDVPAFSERMPRPSSDRILSTRFANHLLGMVRLHRGEYDKAEDLFLRSLEKGPNAPALAGSARSGSLRNGWPRLKRSADKPSNWTNRGSSHGIRWRRFYCR